MKVGTSDEVSDPASVSHTNAGRRNATRYASRPSLVPKARAVATTFAAAAIFTRPVDAPTVSI